MTKFVKRLVSLFMGAAILILAACGSLSVEVPTADATSVPANTEVTPSNAEELVNTQWVLESIIEGGVEPLSFSTAQPYLEFRENGEAGGSGGCNTFSTQYQAQEGQISFGPVASTKIACAIDIMQKEQKFFDALGSADRFELAGDTLQIWYAQGQNVLTFSRTTLSTLVPVESTPTSTALAPTIINPTSTSAASGSEDTEQRIRFEPGSTSATVTGNLAAAQADDYILRALAGQTLSVDLSFTEGRAILVIWGDDGNVLISDHAEVSSFEAVLPTAQDYHITVKGRPDGNTAYTMTVDIPAISTGMERIEFAAGSTSATLTGQLNASESAQYVLNARAGQTMNIDLAFSEGNAILVVWGADGDVLLSDHAEASAIQRVLPTTQDYYILVKGRPDGNTSYSMTVTIPPSP